MDIVGDLLDANPREWYVEKITRLAKAGAMKEHEFYRMLGYPDPGTAIVNLGEVSLLREHFRAVIKPLPPRARAAQRFRQGRGRTTAVQNQAAYTRRFIEILQGPARPMPRRDRLPRRRGPARH